MAQQALITCRFRMLDDMDIGADERRQMFSDVQYCESIAIKVMMTTSRDDPGFFIW